ncbi:MAG TPA: nucleotide sugar dehydrogenase [Methanosarcinales archaeon]|nr:nucleotide sugar dehydrogenase [Methanosarcinales archaeon]
MKIYGLEKNKIIEVFKAGEITVSVYGLGKMGLPLAAVFADKGAKVIGVDIDKKVVDGVNKGTNHIPEEPELTKIVEKNVSNGRLCATTDLVYGAKNSEVMIIIVPTFLDTNNNPDLSIVTSVCKSISKGLEVGDFVSLESTVPPRTTHDIILPILEASGLKKGEFGVAHCPERTMSGTVLRDITRAYPKVVGGIDAESTETAEALYSVINEKGVIPVKDATTAEAVKVVEGVYRDVNIALANQLALVCEEIGINAMEVFKVANTQPYSQLHTPSCGVGGHCIPVYPYFLIKTVNRDTSLLELARKINDGMARYTLEKIKSLLNGGLFEKNILVLGLTYRGGVKETRKSPGVSLVKLLKESGARVFAYDPLLSLEEVEEFGAKYVQIEKAEDLDAVIIASDHKEFKSIDWFEIGKRMRNKVLIDGTQLVDPEQIKLNGFWFYGIGR